MHVVVEDPAVMRPMGQVNSVGERRRHRAGDDIESGTELEVIPPFRDRSITTSLTIACCALGRGG